MALAEPPLLLDGARVLKYAVLDERGEGVSTLAGGMPLDGVSGLVIAENLAEPGAFLLHCNDDWATLAASTCADLESALRLFAIENPGMEVAWRDYHALSPEEQAEVDTTRAFLRELQADFGGT